MRTTLLLLLALAFLLAKIGQAQALEKSGIIKTKDGVLVVWNEPNNYFTAEIKGRQIVPAGQGPNLYFNVDGRFLQINTAPLSDFWKQPVDRLHSSDVLREHRQWELDYLGKIFGRQLFASTDWLKLTSGETALSWSFNVPNATSDQNQAKKQFYITTVNGDRVYLVNSALTSIDNDEQAIRKYLLDTINTMKRLDKPLSLDKAAETIRRGM